METIRVDGLTICFDPADADSAGLAADACRRTLILLWDRYSLKPPADCRVYIMTSWQQFAFQASPWPWKFLIAATIPIWVFRIGRMWPYVGGWELRFGHRHTVGIKPPRLLATANTSMGNRLFRKVEDPRRKIQHITCHELTHAVTNRLGLPMWLKEGLAMRVVDHFAGEPTMKTESLDFLEDTPREEDARLGRGWRNLLRLYARGYWVARYLEEAHPGTLGCLLEKRLSFPLGQMILYFSLG